MGVVAKCGVWEELSTTRSNDARLKIAQQGWSLIIVLSRRHLDGSFEDSLGSIGRAVWRFDGATYLLVLCEL